jgi:hypothetical protein
MSHTTQWDRLAVELAVKIQDLLEPNEGYPPYEYFAEATKIVEHVLKSKDENEDSIAQTIAAVMSESLEFKYDSSPFKATASFLLGRVHYIQRYMH